MNEREALLKLRDKYVKRKKDAVYNLGFSLGFILSTVDRTILAAVLCAIGTKVCVILGILNIIAIFGNMRRMRGYIKDVKSSMNLGLDCMKAIDIIDEKLEKLSE